MTESISLSFIDIRENTLTDISLGGVRRGLSSNPYSFKVVNDGPDILNLILKTTDTRVKLSYPEFNQWNSEINFPLNNGEEKEIVMIIISTSTDPLGPDTCDLQAIIDFDYNIENL